MKNSKNIESYLLNKFDSYESFKDKQHLFKEGSPFNGVFFVLEGKVKITKGENGKSMAMWFAEQGELVGISSYFSTKNLYSFSAIASGGVVKVFRISENDFKELLVNNPVIAKEIIEHLCNRLNYTENRLCNNPALNKFLDRIELKPI